MYEKRPDFACGPCHKSFKNQRALDAHNEAKHPHPVNVSDDGKMPIKPFECGCPDGAEEKCVSITCPRK